MADSDHERGENVCVLMLITYLGNIRNTVKGLLNIDKRASTPKNNQTVANITFRAKEICSKI